MTVKVSSKDMVVTKSPDKLQVVVSVLSTTAGSRSPNIAYFVYQPFLKGEDYPSLVKVWDNKNDDIYDNL
jgi:hypothetical protein